MKLVPEWRKVLRKAWSVRLLALAGILSGVEAALPLFTDAAGLRSDIMSAFTLLAVSGAFVARLVAQKAFEKEPSTNDKARKMMGKVAREIDGKS